MPFRRIDYDGPESRHQVASDERPGLLLENANVASGMARSVNHAQLPARRSLKFKTFIRLKNAIDFDESFEIAQCDRMSGNLDASLFLQMIRPAHMIAMQVRQPDLFDISLRE